MKMIEAGKHVICEKPLAVTPEEIRSCAERANEKGVIYTEAIMYMHSPDRDALREAVLKAGNITSAHFEFSQLSSRYASYLRGETPNIFNPSLAAGCLMDLGVYCVYPAVDLFGMPEGIKADAVFLRTGADGSGNASFNYGDKLVTLTYSKTGQNHFGSSIYGDKGTVTVESISKTVNINFIDNDGNVTPVCSDRIKEEIMGFEAAEFERFIKNPHDPKYLLCTETSLKVSELMERIREICNIKFS
jgi:predicted dehydrogenase